jgi:hypothetical protein
MVKWLGLVAVLLFPMIAQANPAATAQEFAAVMQDKGHRQMVLEAAMATPVWARIGCAAATFAQAPQIAVYAPIVFDKNGEPVSGEWRESEIATGCGAPITLNVLTKVTAPAALSTGYLLPGASIADPILQNAAQGFAVKAAGGVPPGCKAAFIANTAFAGYDGPDAAQKTGPWREIWTLDFCGPPIQVVVRFDVGATGTTISAAPQNQ